MTVEVALAFLEHEGRCLLQLRDDISNIAWPGRWGFFGGRLESGEHAHQAIQRELDEEIANTSSRLESWFTYQDSHLVIHMFKGLLEVSLVDLELREGQDMLLVSPAELTGAPLWSPKIQEYRHLAPIVTFACEQWVSERRA